MKLLTLSPRAWQLLAGAAVAVLAMFGLRAWLGAGDWAGLGQWIGGLGAFAAAWVALRIAKNEAGRENRRDAEARRIHAYYVAGGWRKDEVDPRWKLEVANLGSEPVTKVRVLALHFKGQKDREPFELDVFEERNVLLPNKPWVTGWLGTVDEDVRRGSLDGIDGPRQDVEITFVDLDGTRWRRIGTRPPFKDETA